MKHLMIALTALSLLSLSSCGKKEKFEYELTYNGCATGKQSFDSQDALCTGLKNDELNNYCADNLRQQKFEQECPGSYSN